MNVNAACARFRHRPSAPYVLALLALAVAAPPASAQVLFQQFYYPIDPPPKGVSWWRHATGQLPALSRLGVAAIWTPVPVKGGSGAQSMGYDPYDLYDLGAKDQKGTVATRFGTKAEYLAYVAAAHANGIRVYADVVLNHAGGADVAQENPLMARLGWDDIADDNAVPPRHRPAGLSPGANLRSWTGFRPAGAGAPPGAGRFPRTWRHFHPSEIHPDRNEPYHKKEFAEDLCFEAENGYVARGLNAWGEWFRAQTGVDGYRLDAVKLVEPAFLDGFSARVRRQPAPSGGPFFLVGEFWDTNQDLLSRFQAATRRQMSLFDFGLFYALWDMTEKPGAFDMRTLLSRRLPDRARAVSFVSNHDVDRFQPIARRKRILPYAITLAMSGRPSVFHLDYFRPEDPALPPALRRLVAVHNRFAVGREIVRFADADVLVLERERNLLAAFHDGGRSGAARRLRVRTAFGPRVRLRTVGSEPVGPANETITSADGSVTLVVPPGGFVLLVRADATPKTHPDRFAARGPLPTTQVTEFADDLDTGRLGGVWREVPVLAAAGTAITARVTGTRGKGAVSVEVRDPQGRALKAPGRGRRGGETLLRVGGLPRAGVYRIRVRAPGPPTAGRVAVTYTAPALPGGR